MFKKILSTLALLALTLGVAVSCGGDPCAHESVNANGVCEDCGEDTLTGLHLDNDYHGVCDICQSDIEISLIWHYTDTWHWMTYDDRYGPIPDVVFSEGEHVDEDIDGTCDLCKYKMTE